MKKAKTIRSSSAKESEMLPEYDFSGKKGVRGKYYRAYQQGYTVKIHRENGTTETRVFTPEAGAVVLDPDVLKRFPDSKSVNAALRTLIVSKPAKLKSPVKRNGTASRKRLTPPAAAKS